MANRDNQHCTLFKLVRTTGKSLVDSNNGILYCNDSDDFDECVFMTSRMFKEIWGKTWSSMSQEERLLPVVEISYKGQSIFRRYRQVSADGLCMHQLGLTQRSIGLLCADESLINQTVIEVKVGTKEQFFENHPNHSTRMSYRMSSLSNKIGRQSLWIGWISLSFAIFSVVLSLILHFCF